MGQLGPKLRRVGAREGYTAGGLAHWCPACESMHAFALDGPNANGARWTWDGNVAAPSFAPSMHIKWGKHADPAFDDSRDPARLSGVCHYFLKGGQIQFLGDCTHALKGQTVPLPDLPDGLRD